MTMRNSTVLVVGFLTLASALSAVAEIKVLNELRAGSDAAGFKFEKVPRPSRNDAAGPAKFTLVDGAPDNNGGRPNSAKWVLVKSGRIEPGKGSGKKAVPAWLRR